MDKSIYTPSKWGNEYHNLPHREALGAGSAGPGKTMVLLFEPTFQIAVEHERCANPAHPYHQTWGESAGWALHLRRHFTSLEQTLARAARLFPRIDTGARWVASTNTWHFSSGYRYQFGHCKDSDSWLQYYSNEYSIICFDELTQFEEEQYDQITTRLRSSDPVLSQMLKIRSMSNPVTKQESGVRLDIKNPHWVRDKFVDPWPQGRKTLYKVVKRMDGTEERLTRIYLPAKLSDNPDPNFVRSYELQLLDKPPHIRRALLDGDWYVTPGSYFGESWINDIHVMHPFRIPDDWPQFRAMDWGFKKPGVVYWFAMDEDGNLFVHREMSFQGKSVEAVGKMVESVEKKLGLWKDGRSIVTGPADTQLWEERGDIGESKAMTFAKMGISWTKANKKSRTSNAQRLLTRLNDHHGRTTTPGIVFFNTCKMAIRTIPQIQADPNDPETPSDGGDDHYFDAVGYGCAYASHGRIGLPRPPSDQDDDDDDDNDSFRRRGRYGYGSEVA